MSANRSPRCVILGGGGHARVVIDTLRAGEWAVPYAILDADPARWQTRLLDVPIRGGDDRLAALQAEGVTTFVVGLGGAGDNAPRRRLFDVGVQAGLTPLNIRHPSAVCSPWSEFGAGTVVLPAAVVNAGARIGRNVIVNTGAIVEHDCEIGDHVHVATGARLCGEVRVGLMAHIGAGAVVRQGCSIGEGAIIGAQALVIRDVAPWTVVGGVPAQRLEATRNVSA